MTQKASATILIVEDDAEIALMVSEYLKGEGFVVSVSENGATALTWLSQNKTPDLILLDMMMPVMDGHEFSVQFHDLYGNASPVVVMSAAIDIRERAKKISATGWIIKPFALGELHEIINETLTHA